MAVRLDKKVPVKSRTLAAELIKQGKVTVNGKICTKPSFSVNDDDIINVADDAGTTRYVSRGGLKLEAALNAFNVDLNGKVCLDVGASTGGFTDCMLQHGASKVYAVDVGTNQLDAKLLNDNRVVSTEQCDIRKASLPETIEFFAMDVSFISVKLLLPDLLKHRQGIVLIKPQFELGKRHKGVITDNKLRQKIVGDVVAFTESAGFTAGGVIESPITGKSGNTEFLMLVIAKG